MKNSTLFQKLFNKKVITIAKIVLGGLFTVSFIIVAWYTFFCTSQKVCHVPYIERIVRHQAKVVAPHEEYFVEIADTDSSRAKGLSGRKELREGWGVLFVFDDEGKYGFWMKDMNFALDIIWINKDGFVVEVERNVLPESYPKMFTSIMPAKYVLEINTGEAEKAGIYIGTKVKIER